MRTRTRMAFFLILALCCAQGSVRAAADWQVVKVGGWDYLTVENVARFYGFAGEVAPINKTIRLDNGKNQLELTLDSREAIVNGVRNWLCFPVISNPEGKFLISRIDLAKSIEPQFRPHMIKNLGHLKTVVIDAGHGGVEKGAASSYGNEKDFTLDVALKLRPLLQAKGFNVVMTRERDELVPLPVRARIANSTRDSIFVSIHFNATDSNSSATGFEIYSLTPRGAPSTQDVSLEERFANVQIGSPVDAQSVALSTSVYHSMLGYMPEFDRGVKRARFAVLRLTGIPAILVEGGFLTEREESKLIGRSEWRAKLAQSIAVGIDNYRGLVEKKQRPALLADYRRQIEGVLVARNATAPGPGADAPPPVYPASNRISSAPEVQVTNAVHPAPSEQLSVTEAPLAAAGSPEVTSQPPSGEPPANLEVVEDANANVATVAEQSPASAEDTAGAMPDAQEAEPAASAVEVASLPSSSADNARVRKYWVLKLNPPPKFRE